VTLRVRPSEEPVSLQAYVTNTETGASFQVALKRGPDGLHEGTSRPLPSGVYRVVVKGGPEVVPVANVFAVFPSEQELPRGELPRMPRPAGPARTPPPIGPAALEAFMHSIPDPSLEVFLPDLGRWVTGPNGEKNRSVDLVPVTKNVSGAQDEGVTIVRNPSISPRDIARPGQELRLSVDLLLGELDPETESGGLSISKLDPNWRELPIKVKLLCSEMEFQPGDDTGVVMVQRNKPSLPAKLSGTVLPNAAGELTVVATFEYSGRFCGAARRVIPIEPGGASVPGPSSATGSTGGPARGQGAEAAVEAGRVLAGAARAGRDELLPAVPLAQQYPPGRQVQRQAVAVEERQQVVEARHAVQRLGLVDHPLPAGEAEHGDGAAAVVQVAGVAGVGRQRARLDAAEHADAAGLDVDRPAADPVVGEPAVAVPGLEVEAPVAFPPLALQPAHPRGELVAEDGHPVRVVAQDLAQLLDRGVVQEIAFAGRGFVLLSLGHHLRDDGLAVPPLLQLGL